MASKKEDDPSKMLNEHLKKMTDGLKGLDAVMKNATQTKEEEKSITKIGSMNVVVRRMSNGITTIEYQNKADQKKHFDSLKK